MNNGKVILSITVFEASKESNTTGGYQYDVDGKSEDIIKALTNMCIVNPVMGEVLKFVVNGLKKRETPLIPPKSPYQA
jgi:hypothetical protein